MTSRRTFEIKAQDLAEAQKAAVTHFNLSSNELLDHEVLEAEKKSFIIFGNKNTTYKFSLKPDYEKLAKEFLERIFIYADLDLMTECTMEETTLRVHISGQEEDLLVDNRGALLTSLDHLLKKALGKQLELPKNFRLQMRAPVQDQLMEERLHKLAEKMKQKAIAKGQCVVLSPLSPKERRVVHQYLDSDDQVTTKSLGDGRFKKIKIELLNPNAEPNGNLKGPEDY